MFNVRSPTFFSISWSSSYPIYFSLPVFSLISKKMSPSFCSGRCSAALFLVISAVPIAYLISLELAVPSTHVFSYQSSGFFRECAKWDDVGRRFLVSFMDGGGVGEIVPKDSDDVLEEVTLVKDVDLAGNASLGIVIDRVRNRLLVAVADLLGNRYSALAAYDLSTWRRLFLAELSGHSKEKTFADDVAVDEQGNAYVTDAKASKIWKVDVNGKLVNTITSSLFTPPGWYNNLVTLNGSSSSKLVESSDGWRTASVTGWFSSGMVHRLVSSATVKEGRVYLNHIVGFGSKKKHVLVEAVF
ncbi:uncharacterized protein LOC9322142 isoform X2 [Arabidopsis lyrata subsp. lyrata]|uniref:uncharacterized protein LOC9322142 isoform X2 n=1 Tax=Arabidopsis lyrata subsp. lyrata TaxID=81972 RepID=UPI000A29ABC3|nr:uncharacterized protein LOC9322142 isoform X2 [Arabidopsis lyrata subsp. lyrata]|eukprot:XP_020885875.1 uncharacterized protein LOC9322142 isoform X2 [Arabidopsis lyrata subsp. lyrata]